MDCEIIECEQLGVNEIVTSVNFNGVVYRGCLTEVEK